MVWLYGLPIPVGNKFSAYSFYFDLTQALETPIYGGVLFFCKNTQG
jgi:hypothetical protein